MGIAKGDFFLLREVVYSKYYDDKPVTIFAKRSILETEAATWGAL